MAKHNWEACLAHTKISEGGYVNDPVDPGGETKYGISKRSYPSVDIRNLTWEDAAAIYRRDYWDAVRGDDLPAGLDLVAFAGAVNSGVSRGAKWVQGALGVAMDGRIGPETLRAAKSANIGRTIDAACDARLAFMRGLRTWWKYKNGWTARVTSVRATAKDMASKPTAKGFDWGAILRVIMGAFKR